MDNLKATKEKLDSAYAKFAAACKAIDDQIMQSKKKQLEALIEKTDALLKEVATVDYEENRNVATPVPVSLQCTNAQGKAYISSNADQTRMSTLSITAVGKEHLSMSHTISRLS